MHLFLLAAGFLILLYGLLKAIISCLYRFLPEASSLFESLESYVWVPAAMIALMLATFFAPFFK